MSRELGDDFNAPAFIEVGAVKPPQAQLPVGRTLQQQGPNMRLFRISADDANAIMEVGFGLRNRLPVNEPNQWPQQQVDENDKTGRQRRMQRMPGACEHSYRRRAPQRSRGVEAGDMKSLAKDNSRTREADSGDNLRRHPCGTSFNGKQTCEDHKACGTDCDQRVGPQARHPLTPLALEPDARAQQRCRCEADSRLINRCAHSGNPSLLPGAFAGGGPEPAMLRPAPAIASLTRRSEDRGVRSCAAGAGSSRSARCCLPAGKLRWRPIVSRLQSGP